MNKQVIFIALFLSLISFSTRAQKTGIKGGVNFTNLYVDDVDDENMKIGFNAGIYHRAEIAGFFGIQPELLFSQKGSEIQYDDFLFGSGKYRFNLNYLEVPVLAVFSLGSFNVHAGPYVGLLISANVKDVDDNGNINDVESLERDDFNTLDTGVAVGAGFDFTGGTLGIRYNYGFQEIGKNETAVQATSNSKNSALQLYIGFDF